MWDDAEMKAVELKERNESIVAMRDGGKKFSEIAKVIGISYGRVRQIYCWRKWRENRPAQWDDGLSVRASNCLRNANIENREDVKRKVLAGEIWRGGKSHYRNMGWKTYCEICVWAGLSEPKKPTRKTPTTIY